MYKSQITRCNGENKYDNTVNDKTLWKVTLTTREQLTFPISNNLVCICISFYIVLAVLFRYKEDLSQRSLALHIIAVHKRHSWVENTFHSWLTYSEGKVGLAQKLKKETKKAKHSHFVTFCMPGLWCGYFHSSYWSLFSQVLASLVSSKLLRSPKN